MATPKTEQEKKEYTERTIKLCKDLDIIFAVITTIDDNHLKDSYNSVRETYERMSLLDQSIQANKLATDLLNSQASTLLKITELKRNIIKANEFKNEISKNPKDKKKGFLDSALKFIKKNNSIN